MRGGGENETKLHPKISGAASYHKAIDVNSGEFWFMSFVNEPLPLHWHPHVLLLVYWTLKRCKPGLNKHSRTQETPKPKPDQLKP